MKAMKAMKAVRDKKEVGVGQRAGSYYRRRKDGQLVKYRGGRHQVGRPRRRINVSKDSRLKELEARTKALEAELRSRDEELARLRANEHIFEEDCRHNPGNPVRDLEADAFADGRKFEYKRWWEWLAGIPSAPPKHVRG